jgi:predicted outer membrane repeat protein
MRTATTICWALALLVPAVQPDATAVAQTTWYVDDDAPNDPGPGDPSISDPAEDGSADHPFDAIQEAIDIAAEGDTILLADGLYTGVGNRALVVALAELTIRSATGPDTCIIDCQGLGRGILFQSGATAQSLLEGVTIRNGSDVGGAGIFCFSASPAIRNCVLAENSVTSDGAGLLVLAPTASPSVENCTFIGNDAVVEGGAISVRQGSTPIIHGCTFTDNSASSGGAVSIGYSAQPTFVDCAFLNNTADREGGALHVVRSWPPLLISRCSFAGNMAGWNGGAVATEGGLWLTECDFHSNDAQLGGALYRPNFAYPIDLIDCTFTGNAASTSGGAVYADAGDTLFISGCTFSQNTATGNSQEEGGGAVFTNQTPVELRLCDFDGNTAVRYGGGWYDPFTNRDTSLYANTFRNNTATTGGGILLLGAYGITLDYCTFADNVASASGGGAYVPPNSTLFDCSFLGNQASRGGGLTAPPGATVSLCAFTGNTAETYGGATAAFDASFNECTFTANSAEKGGGIWAGEGDTTLTDCRLISNAAELDGGGAYRSYEYPDTGTLLVNSCLLVANTADNYGGGTYGGDCHNCTFARNCAQTLGGGIYAKSGGFVRARDSVFWLNQDSTGQTESGQIAYEGTTPGTIDVNYCCVQGWTGTIVGSGNIGDYPRFVAGYYLSQVAAGQGMDSPCVDAGDPASDVPDGTTRTDGVVDAGVVDMGYHYPDAACIGDLNGDGYRNIADFALWAAHYPSTVGNSAFDPAADLNGDGVVNIQDFVIFAGSYGQACP